MKPVRRLLIVTTVPRTISAFLLPFAQHLRARGWRVDAASRGVSADAQCVDAFDSLWDVQWSRNPLDPRNLMETPRAIAGLVQREGYDIVHVHTPVASFVTRYAMSRLPKDRRPVVVYTAHGFHFYRGGNPLKNALFLALEKLAGRWTDYLVVINREDESAALRYGIVPRDRVFYMPGIGVDTSSCSPEAVSQERVDTVREELGLSDGEQMLLMVAEFIPRKRHRDALTALSRLESPTAILALAGEGPLMEPMKRLASDLGIAHRVRFLGFRRDVPALVRSSAAVVLVSAHEGLARSVMESLSLEVPVIGSDVRGIRELLESGSGYLVRVGDIDGISRAMRRALDHEEEASAMGRLGRTQMAACDVQRIVGMHVDLYSAALGEASDTPA